MPRRTAAHAEAMRGRILDGARRAFVGAGYRGASVPEIAREAGVSVGLIYRYFPSRDELLTALDFVIANNYPARGEYTGALDG